MAAVELAAPLAMFVLFAGLYGHLHMRAESRSGQRLALRWTWLALIAVAAGIAIVVGAVARQLPIDALAR
jgi:hypothetical protein